MAVCDLSLTLRYETVWYRNPGMATTTDTRPRAGRGRPRDPSCDEAILEAAIELIGEVGYDRASLGAVAARAGVSKPTIYRRWPEGKEQLATAAVARCHEDMPEIDTGSLRQDLIATVEQMISGMRQNAHLAAGLTQRLRESPQLAEAFRREIVAAKRQRFEAIVGRAVERGELDRIPTACALLADLVPSVIHSRSLITGDPLDRRFVTQLVDHVLLPALAAAPESGGRR